MKIKLIKNDDPEGFQIINSKGVVGFVGDNSEESKSKSFSPMEMLLNALAGCMSIDILLILGKQKINPKTFSLEIEGIRKDISPKSYERIIMRFKISKNVDPTKIERAIQLSKEKYCSVSKSLNKSIDIEHSIDHI